MGIPVGVIAGQLLAATASNLVHCMHQKIHLKNFSCIFFMGTITNINSLAKTHPLFLMYISDTNVKFFSSQFSSMMMDPIMEGHGQGGHTRDVIQQIPEDSKSWSLIVPEERKR